MDAPSAAIRDVAQLLDIHVHQVTGCGVLVTADQLAAAAVQAGQRWAAIAAQHSMHRRGVEAQAGTQPSGPQPPTHPEFDDSPLDALRRTPRAGTRPTGVVNHAHRALSPVTVSPPLGSGV